MKQKSRKYGTHCVKGVTKFPGSSDQRVANHDRALTPCDKAHERDLETCCQLRSVHWIEWKKTSEGELSKFYGFLVR